MLFLKWLFLPLVVFAHETKWTHWCESDAHDGVLAYSWCIDQDQKHLGKDVLIYLHGRLGTAEGWMNDPLYQRLRGVWLKKTKKPFPTVISVSFGPQWFLTQSKNGLHAHLMDKFRADILPKLLLKAKVKTSKKPRLLGQSMGGLNAALLLVNDPGRFQSVALLCPALPPIGPFAKSEELKKFYAKPYIHGDWYDLYLKDLQAEFPSVEEWSKQNPMNLIHKLSKRAPKVYVSASDQDEYGFFPESKRFADLAGKAGVHVEWVPIYGKPHCWQTDESLEHLARFLSEN